VLNPIPKIVKSGILFSYVIYSYLIIFTPSGRVTGCSIMWTVGREFIELPQAEQTRDIKSTYRISRRVVPFGNLITVSSLNWDLYKVI
jgi:hypothetical protein